MRSFRGLRQQSLRLFPGADIKMIGVMPRLLLDFVEKNWGEAAQSRVLLAAGLAKDGEIRLDTHYPDEQWRQLVHASIAESQLPADQWEMSFARYCGEDLVLRFAGFFRGADSAREVIRRQPKIHNFIAASLQDAQIRKAVSDKFRLEETDEETIMHYVSLNKHCVLYRGLAQWVADYFGERIEIHEPQCLKQGDAECEIHVRYLGTKT